MLERIIVMILTNLGSWLLSKALQYFQKNREVEAEESDIDARVLRVKDVLKESLDGKPLTPDQKKEFKDAVRGLIRGGPSTDKL